MSKVKVSFNVILLKAVTQMNTGDPLEEDVNVEQLKKVKTSVANH